MPKSEPIDIRDIKGPLDWPSNWKAILALLGIALLIFAVLLLIRGLKKKKKDEALPLPPRPPYETALARLKALKDKGLIKQGKVMEYYIELSDIVRHYLEERFELKAPEMSTEEFLLVARNHKALSYELKGLLREFLSHCDLVKFAKYGPSDSEIEASFESATRLVEETHAIP